MDLDNIRMSWGSKFHWNFLFVVTRKQIHLGCSQSIYKKFLGCQPVDKPCNPLVLVQISTQARASECYCEENGCNIPSEIFKVITGGYLVTIIGTFGIIGNFLAFGVLVNIEKKNEVDIILAGKLSQEYTG